MPEQAVFPFEQKRGILKSRKYTMNADLYLSYHLATQEKTLVIEGDGFSVWAYLLQEDEETIDFSCFLCATGPLVEGSADVERFLEEGNQPPLMQDFANEYSVVENLHTEDISVEPLDAETISVSIRGKEYLRIDTANKSSYSIAVAKDGPYGLMMNTRSTDEEEE